MDGKNLRDYWSNEVKAILETYKQFETLIPSRATKGSAHNAEDGRFVEELLRECLQRFLPKGLVVLTGFILRPAVKTGENSREREDEKDQFSSQLDIIIFDSENYPIFQRFGNTAIVPPEGVIAIISVKKHLRDEDIENECEKLFKASLLCNCYSSKDNSKKSRGPYLALVSMTSLIDKKKAAPIEWVFNEIKKIYESVELKYFDSYIGFIGSLQDWSIFKARPDRNKLAKYVGLVYKEGETHLALQFILTGILSVFYDETRRNLRRPGYTAFESNRTHDRVLGHIPFSKLR